jgi:retinal rod rhodopsin-sensitive cGMP 3',5'-cyclic phosphodiesterase subunit delta
MCFYSKHAIKEFKILQRMKLNEHVVEDLCFNFGFVIPGSTNTWDQVIEADKGNVMPAEVLSGNLIAETYFM